MGIADLLLSIAAWIAPPERSTWAQAMRAEYQTLESGRLRWALGCLAVSCCWRLVKEGLYFALVSAALWFMIANPLFFVEAPLVKMDTWLLGVYPPLLNEALICVALGAYRPSILVCAVVILVVLTEVFRTWEMFSFATENHDPSTATLMSFFRDYHIYNARPLVAATADFGACIAGGLLGRSVNRVLRRNSTG